jgi:hypothetical protein
MITIGATFLGLMVILFLAFFNFDAIVKIEYQRHKDDWIKDGKPIGFFWRSPESSWFSSAFAMQGLSLRLLFKTPRWVDNEPAAMACLKKLRKLVLIFNIGVIVWAILSMVIYQRTT